MSNCHDHGAVAAAGTPPGKRLAAGRNAVRVTLDTRVERNDLALLLAASIQMLAINPAQAQEQAPVAQSAGLEEIVINAEKRSAGLQSTPIAVDAVGADALTQQGVNDSPWAMLDLSLRYEAPGSKWSVTGYVRNVTDALRPVTERYDTSSGMIVSSFYPPRTFGVIVSAKMH